MAAPPRPASINNVAFRAPVHTSYDHSTGGGAWNTGGVTYVKGELAKGLGDWEQRLNTALVPTTTAEMTEHAHRPPTI